MFQSLVGRLACPRTGEPLRFEPAPGIPAGDPVDSGALVSTISGRRYPIERGIPRLLSPDSPMARDAATTRAAFERQWRHYARLPRIFGKDTTSMAKNLVNDRIGRRIRRDWYRDKWVLDAGCGHGRYLREFAKLGATAVGIDVGDGPELARVPLHDPRIHVVQGDVLQLPFADRSFDLAFCDGVLHHTPDPKRGFLELARVVKRGGRVVLATWKDDGNIANMFGVMKPFMAAPSAQAALPSPFAWGKVERLRELLGGSFELAFETGTNQFRYATGEQAWNLWVNHYGPAKTLAASLDDGRREEFKRAMVAWHETFASPLGFEQPRTYVITHAVRK